MKKRWIYLLTALTLAVGVCTAKPIISGAAAIDLTKKCSMTIFPEDPQKKDEVKFGEDLLNANILVDVYKVASAVKTPGYDSYTYKFEGPYSGLEESFLKKLENQQNTPPKKEGEESAEDVLKASDWQALAQAVGKIALGDGKDQKPNDTAIKTDIDITDESKNMADGLEPGLYLLIARSESMENIEDYRVTMQSTTDVNGNIATIANSNQYTYIFSPQLISVPMRSTDIKGPAPDSENGPIPGGTEDYMTSNSGAWTYDVNVYLKPVRTLRYGALEIEKKLLVYETEEEVDLATPTEPSASVGQEEKTTFVFKATWPNPDYDSNNANSKPTQSKIDSITFPIIKEDGTKAYDWYLYMDRIPVGVDVTVEEIYSGASYENADKEGITRTIQVQADPIKNGIVLLNDNNTVKTIINPSELAPEVDGNGKRTVPVEASVAFTNTYNWDQKKGYGIKNQFTYDENGNWLWTSDPQQEAGDPGMPIFNGEISHLDVEQTPQ